MKDLLFKFKLLTIRDGWKKAQYIKKKQKFKYIGENVFYLPNKFPSEPFLVSIGNNVVISTGVRIVTHSVEHVIFNIEEGVKNKYKCRFGKIEIGNNVYIGADSIICPGVRIGNNCIIGAGAVVTKDIEDGSVVAGVPAKKINTYDNLKNKSLEWSKNFPDNNEHSVKDLVKYINID